jgi:S-formylglutathione hydrolase FrmB
MDVIIPQTKKSKTWRKTGKHPTLFLLHGLSDDHTIWQRRTSIERYVEPLGLAVVMPAVNRSWYTDTATGERYWTYISEEIPKLAREFFPLSEAREHNFVAGLSMGGYGAFKLALRCPRKFAAVASLSGALDMQSRIPEYDGERVREMTNIFGDLSKFPGSLNDLFFLAHRLAKSNEEKPLMFQCCGTEDYLYSHNTRFRNHAKKLSLPLVYEEGPGTHDWGFWDHWIQRVLKWLPLE